MPSHFVFHIFCGLVGFLPLNVWWSAKKVVTCTRFIVLTMANQDIIERIKYLIREMRMTQGEFAEKIGCDQSNLSKHLNGRLPISDSLVNKIVINMGVSKAWLKDGADVPFAKQSGGVPSLVVDESEMMSMKGTPIYNIDVTAGGECRAMEFADEHIVGAVNLPGISPECRIVKVCGDSMSPVIMHGDLIAVRELSNLSQIFWGNIYVVVLDNLRMVKYLRRHDDPDKVILRSENPKYDDMEVNRSDIRDLLVVQSVIRVNNL